MTWHLLNARSALGKPSDALASDWAALNSELFQDHPLLSSEFVVPLVHHFAGPNVLLAHADEVGPRRALVLLRPRRAGFWSTFLPSQAPIAPALLGESADVDRLIRALPGFALSVDFLCQDPEYSGVAGEDPHAAREKIRHLTTTAAEINSSFAEYWATRPKNLRRNMKRYFNRLAVSGDQPRMNVLTEHAEVRSGLQRYGTLESAGWKGAAGTAIHPENQQGRFYADVLEGFSRRGQFRVYELYVGDQLAASRLCILNRSMLIVLKTTYDENLSHYAPGRVLLHMLLEREFAAREISRVEFYTNANPDSLSWATTSRDIFHVSQYRLRQLRNVIVKSRPWRRALRDKLSPRQESAASQPDQADPD